MPNSGIYQIINLVNGEKYIGSSVNISRRFNSHKHLLSKGNHHSCHLQRAFDKYGKENFAFSILLYCSPDNALFYEQICLDNLKPEYNIAKNSTSTLGIKLSEETRKKISIAGRGRVPHNKGKAHTEEARQKMKGRTPWSKTGTFSAKTRKKMSEAQKGKIPWNKGKSNIYSNETLKQFSQIRKGKAVSEETRKKISNANKGKTPWNKNRKNCFSQETLNKMSESKTIKNIWIGRKHSEETKKKQSEARKAHWQERKSNEYNHTASLQANCRSWRIASTGN